MPQPVGSSSSFMSAVVSQWTLAHERYFLILCLSRLDIPAKLDGAITFRRFWQLYCHVRPMIAASRFSGLSWDHLDHILLRLLWKRISYSRYKPARICRLFISSMLSYCFLPICILFFFLQKNFCIWFNKWWHWQSCPNLPLFIVVW